MSALGFDSCFYVRLNQYSKSLNRILIAAGGKDQMAEERDWEHAIHLVKSLSPDGDDSLGASSVAASLSNHAPLNISWQEVIAAIEQRNVDEKVTAFLFTVARSLDEERAATLMRMRQGNV